MAAATAFPLPCDGHYRVSFGRAMRQAAPRAAFPDSPTHPPPTSTHPPTPPRPPPHPSTQRFSLATDEVDEPAASETASHGSLIGSEPWLASRRAEPVLGKQKKRQKRRLIYLFIFGVNCTDPDPLRHWSSTMGSHRWQEGTGGATDHRTPR